MNWWLVTAGVTALICAAGHAFAGRNMFYLPMKAAIKDSLHAGVLTGMWHLITINFTLSAVALLMLGAIGGPAAMAWFVAVQFAGYAAAYLAISLFLGGALKLFQWILFGGTAILASAGALGAH